MEPTRPRWAGTEETQRLPLAGIISYLFFLSIMFKFWSFLPAGTAAAVSAPALRACEALRKCGSQFVVEISGGRAPCYGLLRLEVVLLLLLKNPRPICVGGVCSARERHNTIFWYSSNHLNATILSYTVAPNWVWIKLFWSPRCNAPDARLPNRRQFKWRRFCIQTKPRFFN